MRLIAINRFYAPDHSATAQLLTDLTEDLAVRGVDVTVVASRQRYDDPKAELLGHEVRRGVTVYRVGSSRFGRNWLPGRAVDYASFYLTAFVALLRLVRPGDIILAKTDPPMISVVAWLVAKVRSARLVNWCQDLFPEVAAALAMKWAAGPCGRALRNIRNRSLRGAEANVVLCERMAEQLVSEGVPREQISVVHNWADGELIRPIPHERNRLRREWGLEGRRVIEYSGNLGRAHDLPTVKDFIAAMGEADPEIVFLFVGGGAGSGALAAWAGTRGLVNVQFRPYQPREWLAESLSLPDLHLVSLAPACEGLIMPSKLYGVLAAGRPVVVVGDPHGAPAELVREAGCGVVWSEGREEEVLEWLRSGPATHRRIRAIFEARFCREQALSRWEETLGRATGSSQTSPAPVANAA
jgi:colanic acid biosynthesis glycosyl transferase WcaI